MDMPCTHIFLKKINVINIFKVVEEMTVADDRRHSEAHLAAWISVRDLIEKCIERCPEATLIPSKALVRLQFSPKNPYTKSSLAFTSNLQVNLFIMLRSLQVCYIKYCIIINAAQLNKRRFAQENDIKM